jgi:hypothetical protein
LSQPTYPFLSPNWITAMTQLRDDFGGDVPAAPVQVTININIKDSPHHPDGPIQAHVDTSKGQMMIDNGHMEGPELTITVDYETARTMFISRDPSAVMEAFFKGKILVEGDASKLPVLLAQNMQPTPEAIDLMHKIEALTADD